MEEADLIGNGKANKDLLCINKEWKKAMGGVNLCQTAFLKEMNAVAKEL